MKLAPKVGLDSFHFRSSFKLKIDDGDGLESAQDNWKVFVINMMIG